MQKPTSIQQNFKVDFSFNLHFTSHVFSTKNPLLNDVFFKNNKSKSKALVVVDSGVIRKHPNLKLDILKYFNQKNCTVDLEGNILEIPGGEASKNNEKYVQNILKSVHDFAIDRHSYIVAIGGGAVLDAVGYAAAIAHRGVRLIRIPTTVLSQNDSGIGVKNGINYFNKKNFVGTFAVPYAVINDDSFLHTLEDRDWRAGISEALKVALIKDISFFEWIENHIEKLNQRDLETMNYLIYRCAEMHMRHIQNSGDAFELGSSRPLDFGHWSAHKLEQLSNFKIRHGEAVAVGIALDSTYSFLMGWMDEKSLQRILNVILQLGFSICYKEFDKNVLTGLQEFREHLGGQLTIMLLKELGCGFEVNEINDALVLQSIDYLNKYAVQKHVSL